MICIVLPAYNEEENIESVSAEIAKAMEATGFDYRICIIDDGSIDRTWDVCLSMSAKLPGVFSLYQLSRNFGKDVAILAALSNEGADAYIIMDADGQHPTKYIPAFIDIWKNGPFDIVNGVKRPQSDHSMSSRVRRFIFNTCFEYLTKLKMQNSSDFKLINKSAAEALLQCGDYHYFFRAMTQWIGFRQTDIQFDVMPREDGESKWPLSSLLLYSIRAVILYSSAPAYLLVFMGVAAFCLSSGLSVKLLYHFFMGETPTGYATLLAVSLLSFSTILAAIGIIGLYLQETLEQVKRRPSFIIRDRKNAE